MFVCLFVCLKRPRCGAGRGAVRSSRTVQGVRQSALPRCAGKCATNHMEAGGFIRTRAGVGVPLFHGAWLVTPSAACMKAVPSGARALRRGAHACALCADPPAALRIWFGWAEHPDVQYHFFPGALHGQLTPAPNAFQAHVCIGSCHRHRTSTVSQALPRQPRCPHMCSCFWAFPPLGPCAVAPHVRGHSPGIGRRGPAAAWAGRNDAADLPRQAHAALGPADRRARRRLQLPRDRRRCRGHRPTTLADRGRIGARERTAEERMM